MWDLVSTGGDLVPCWTLVSLWTLVLVVAMWQWPGSNIKRFVSKFMKTFKTILQCYLIQINISEEFITIKGVTNTIYKLIYFIFSVSFADIWWLFYGHFSLSNNRLNIIFPNLFLFIPPRRVNNKILIFMETFSDSFNHFYVFHSLLN